MPPGLGLAVGLVEVLVGTVAGAWLYREATALNVPQRAKDGLKAALPSQNTKPRIFGTTLPIHRHAAGQIRDPHCPDQPATACPGFCFINDASERTPSVIRSSPEVIPWRHPHGERFPQSKHFPWKNEFAGEPTNSTSNAAINPAPNSTTGSKGTCAWFSKNRKAGGYRDRRLAKDRCHTTAGSGANARWQAMMKRCNGSYRSKICSKDGTSRGRSSSCVSPGTRASS
jgi:hypothetical protein